MSSVPFFAINTSCRTLECPRSPIARPRVPPGKYSPRVRSVSEGSDTAVADVGSVTSPGASKAPPPSTSSSPLPTSPLPTSSSPQSVFPHLSLPEVRTRSSSLNHLDKKKPIKTVNTDRDILSMLDIFD